MLPMYLMSFSDMKKRVRTLFNDGQFNLQDSAMFIEILHGTVVFRIRVSFHNLQAMYSLDTPHLVCIL